MTVATLCVLCVLHAVQRMVYSPFFWHSLALLSRSLLLWRRIFLNKRNLFYKLKTFIPCTVVLNIGAVPDTLFIYFVIYPTIHSLFFLGMFSHGYSFFLCWVSGDSCIWANNILPAGPREGVVRESNQLGCRTAIFY